MKIEPGSSVLSRLRRPLGAVRIATANARWAAAAGDPDSLEACLSILNEALGKFEEYLKQLPRNDRRRLRKRYRHELYVAELALFEGSSILNQAEDFLGELATAANVSRTPAD